MLQTPNTSKQIITFNSGSKYSRLEFPERIDNDPHETANPAQFFDNEEFEWACTIRENRTNLRSIFW